MRRGLWVMSVAVRVVAAGVLLFGPWTDEVEELDGWDAARFQQIHDAAGRPWVDHAVEYPPGSVALIELTTQDTVVGTNRVLIVLSLGIDLAVAAFLYRRFPGDVGLAYLLLGTLMVPAQLLRFDVWAAGCTALALGWLHRPRRFGAAIAVGAAIKLAPALLIPAAFAAGYRKAALWASGLGLTLTLAWLSYAGTGAIGQMLSLRDATGWHVETVPGALWSLTTDSEARFEADAYRIGQLNDAAVTIGRIVAVTVAVWLSVLTARRAGDGPSTDNTVEPVALSGLGATAALLVTAPLLSPQFLLWLTPLAAVLWPSDDRRPFWLTAAAIGTTALTVGAFGPPNLDHWLAASLLMARNLLLVGIVLSCAMALRKRGSATGAASPSY